MIHQTDQKALEKRSQEAAFRSDMPSMTQQGLAHDADINNIAKSYGLVGRPMPVPLEVFDPANYADLSEGPPDLQAALNLVKEAEYAFQRLPASLRARFDHNPGSLWEFVQNPANAEEAVALGLLVRPPEIVVPTGSQAPQTPPPAAVAPPGTGGA